MFLTLIVEIDGTKHPITFDGSPKDCQTQANAFLGDGMQVTRIIVMGEK